MVNMSEFQQNIMAIFVYYAGINGWYEGAPEGILPEARAMNTDTDTIPATNLSSTPSSRIYQSPRGREKYTD